MWQATYKTKQFLFFHWFCISSNSLCCDFGTGWFCRKIMTIKNWKEKTVCSIGRKLLLLLICLFKVELLTRNHRNQTAFVKFRFSFQIETEIFRLHEYEMYIYDSWLTITRNRISIPIVFQNVYVHFHPKWHVKTVAGYCYCMPLHNNKR